MTSYSKHPANKNPELTDFLCFAIYSTNLTFAKAYKPALERLGLTYTQYIIIIALWEDSHQTVTSLGGKIFLESNTLTPILKKLQSLGYIHRERDTVDERQVLLSLTDAGRKLRAKAFGAGVSAACGLTATEFADTRESLIRLRANLMRAVKS
ncbi:MarR family winged helix-turn-helix transcriptional regulator [Duganella aceris]|uniref:HTH-type transcriptional regulator SarZ n=1 Tax=Duganella aceris TaxID=2703883 RepID=A0ABX0FTC2_9BURK|nr:MarR family transcriptional regulator [Duganella aceris]NGZ87941.1 MarR family transcriptional regulator [Duganella aceris]